MAAAKGRTKASRKLAPRRSRLRLSSLISLQGLKVFGKMVGNQKSQGLSEAPSGLALEQLCKFHPVQSLPFSRLRACKEHWLLPRTSEKTFPPRQADQEWVPVLVSLPAALPVLAASLLGRRWPL